MSNKHYDIYGIGNALLDKVYHVDKAFFEQHNIDKGVMSLVDEPRMQALLTALEKTPCIKETSGGSVANAVVVASHFGANNFLSVRVADDTNGERYYQDIHAANVSANYDTQARQAGFSGVCLVMVTDDADRTMNSFLGISESLSTHELNLEVLKQSRYLFIEGYLVTSPSAREAVLKARETAKHHGVKTALSLSDPFIVKHFREYFDLFIGDGVDMLFCNEDEAMILGNGDLSNAKLALQQVAKQFVITLGAKGALLYDGSTYIDVPAKQVNAIDTNGAGDMFAGAYLYGLTHDLSHHEAVQLARDAAACIVAQYGPRLTEADALAILNNAKRYA